MKMDYRKMVVDIVVVMAVLTVMMTVIYRHNMLCEENYNNKLNDICVKLQEEHVEITSEELINIINSSEHSDADYFRQFGINLKNEPVLLENERIHKKYSIIEAVICVGGMCLLMIISRIRDMRKDRQIGRITGYVEQINRGNYQFIMNDSREGELFILQNEVYKTMIMLKEAADNSHRDKINLKNSLSDISHQLKTPITSLLINLENLNDMSENEEQQLCVRNARRDVNRISTLVQSVLRLSKLDSNTIEFMRREVSVVSIIESSCEMVMALADLKGIDISVEGKAERGIVCDAYWQTQAMTNIVKNAIEHAKTYVKVRYESNKAYHKIEIENDGVTISDKDRQHIFDRFYKGENATRDSVGIGLSLAKMIVEQDSGYVTVDSDVLDDSTGEGVTVFTVKYNT